MFKLEFETSNEAFQGDGRIDPWAIADVLRDVATDVTDGPTRGTVVDFNGNTVGRWELSGD